jgi:hypothetical protein
MEASSQQASGSSSLTQSSSTISSSSSSSTASRLSRAAAPAPPVHAASPAAPARRAELVARVVALEADYAAVRAQLLHDTGDGDDAKPDGDESGEEDESTMMPSVDEVRKLRITLDALFRAQLFELKEHF